MVIQRINRAPVSTIEDFERVINALKAGDPVVLHVVGLQRRARHAAIVQFTYQ